MLAFDYIARKVKRLFSSGDEELAANRLYNTLVAQARSSGFYARLEVPDTIDGRFDMIAVHAFLILHRLKNAGEKAEKLSQALFDEMFRDMDRSLREMGVGDMGVGKRVRAMGKAFMGRVEAYDQGLDQGVASLKTAIHRNLYRSADVPDSVLSAMEAYLREQAAHLAGQPLPAVLDGNLEFAPFSSETVHGKPAVNETVQ